MPERVGRKFFFWLHAILATLFLLGAVAFAIEAGSGGYALGLLVVAAMADGLPFVILALVFGATAMHLRP